jgi:ABC-type oligopeptide transport system substrate-binding subunit
VRRREINSSLLIRYSCLCIRLPVFVKMEDVNADEFAADANTRVNGPFQIEVWDLDAREYVVVQNPGWWGDTKPYIERIEAQWSNDENIT